MLTDKDLEYKLELPVRKYKNNISFIRDKDGVNAWHCGSLPIDDYRIVKLEIIDEDDERLNDYI